MDNFGKAIDVSVDILSEKVWYFYVFPFFFLKVAKENDFEIYLDLIYDRAWAKRDDKEYKERIDKLVETYSKQVDALRIKSDAIFSIVDGEDPLAFFQEMMSMANLNTFRNLSDIEVENLGEQVKLGKITKQQVLEKLNLKI